MESSTVDRPAIARHLAARVACPFCGNGVMPDALRCISCWQRLALSAS